MSSEKDIRQHYDLTTSFVHKNAKPKTQRPNFSKLTKVVDTSKGKITGTKKTLS